MEYPMDAHCSFWSNIFWRDPLLVLLHTMCNIFIMTLMFWQLEIALGSIDDEESCSDSSGRIRKIPLARKAIPISIMEIFLRIMMDVFYVDPVQEDMENNECFSSSSSKNRNVRHIMLPTSLRADISDCNSYEAISYSNNLASPVEDKLTCNSCIYNNMQNNTTCIIPDPANNEIVEWSKSSSDPKQLLNHYKFDGENSCGYLKVDAPFSLDDDCQLAKASEIHLITEIIPLDVHEEIDEGSDSRLTCVEVKDPVHVQDLRIANAINDEVILNGLDVTHSTLINNQLRKGSIAIAIRAAEEAIRGLEKAIQVLEELHGACCKVQLTFFEDCFNICVPGVANLAGRSRGCTCRIDQSCAFVVVLNVRLLLSAAGSSSTTKLNLDEKEITLMEALQQVTFGRNSYTEQLNNLLLDTSIEETQETFETEWKYQQERQVVTSLRIPNIILFRNYCSIEGHELPMLLLEIKPNLFNHSECSHDTNRSIIDDIYHILDCLHISSSTGNSSLEATDDLLFSCMSSTITCFCSSGPGIKELAINTLHKMVIHNLEPFLDCKLNVECKFIELMVPEIVRSHVYVGQGYNFFSHAQEVLRVAAELYPVRVCDLDGQEEALLVHHLVGLYEADNHYFDWNFVVEDVMHVSWRAFRIFLRLCQTENDDKTTQTVLLLMAQEMHLLSFNLRNRLGYNRMKIENNQQNFMMNQKNERLLQLLQSYLKGDKNFGLRETCLIFLKSDIGEIDNQIPLNYQSIEKQWSNNNEVEFFLSTNHKKEIDLLNSDGEFEIKFADIQFWLSYCESLQFALIQIPRILLFSFFYFWIILFSIKGSPASLASLRADLLLLCGDIESNPGPARLNLTNVLNVSDTVTNWQEIGTYLSVPQNMLESIRAECGGDSRKAKRLLFQYWLGNDPQATWDKLANALAKSGHESLSSLVLNEGSDGSENFSADSGKPSVSSAPALADLVSIPGIESYWKEIGSRLQVSEAILDTIETKHHKSKNKCKQLMFKEAVKRGDLSWKEVLDTLFTLSLQSAVNKIGEIMGIDYSYSDTASPSPQPSTLSVSSSLSTGSRKSSTTSSLSDATRRQQSSPSRTPPKSPRSASPLIQSLGPTTSAEYSASSFDHVNPHSSITTPPTTSQPIVAPPTSYNLSSLASIQSASSSPDNVQSTATSSNPLIGLKVFLNRRHLIQKSLSNFEVSVVATKLYSLNLIAQQHLHDLKLIQSNQERAVKLVHYLEKPLKESSINFERFVAILKCIPEHETLAEELSRAHELQLILHSMQKISNKELNFNVFCDALNQQKLISDDVKSKALSSRSPEEFVTVIHNDLKEKNLAEDFVDVIRQFEDSNNLCALFESGADGSERFKGVAGGDLPTLPTLSVDFVSSTDDSKEGIPSEDSGVKTATANSNPDMESDNFVSAKSSLQDRSVDLFHDSLTNSPKADLVDFHQRTRIDSTTSGGYGRGSRETQESGSGSSTPKNHSARLATELNPTHDDTTPGRDHKPFHTPQPDPAILQRRREREAAYVVAVRKWELRSVRTMLNEEQGLVDHRFEKNRTALMLAAIANQKEGTQLFLEFKASVKTVDVKGYTALYLAAKYGNYELLKIVLKEDEVDVNHKSNLGVPIIVRTSQKGFSVITECLIEHGADVNLYSESDGLTALHAAVSNQHKDVVRLLLEHNADATRVYSKTDRTPLEEAVEGEDPEIVKMLMQAQSKAKAKSKRLFTAKTPDEVKDLVLRYNAKIDCRNTTGATPLIVHTVANHLDIVKKLIQLKANIDLQDNMGYSALMVASKAGSVELVRLLISSGAILDLKERENGYTGLMFAITGVQVAVVKELVLAKANISLRNRDNKSALDLAKEGNNPDILEIVKVQTSNGSSRDDPFVQLLSNYMSNKAANPRLTAVKPQKRRPEAGKGLDFKTYKPPLTSTTPDESSSSKAELEKCYKRIADLEIRVHDLSIATSMDLLKDEDVSYMDKSRLETEYKKLKEAKKKAEQYAVEAKQTAQRLSAENFKLREDLNKERHFNELTRKTIVKEVEKEVELNAKREKLELVRRSVFQEEVAERAYQLVQNDPNRGTIYQKVSFTGVQLKELIMSKSIRMNMYHVLVDGLPDSGKSSLCRQLGIASESQVPSGTGSFPGVDLYEAVLSHATLNNPEHQWINFTDLKGKDGPPVDLLALGLLYFLIGQHQLPKPEAVTEVDALLFDDVTVQEYFVEMCTYLQKLSVQFTTDKEALQKLLTGPLSLVNIFSIYENKPMRELLQAVRGQHSNVLLLDLIDIKKYGKSELLQDENTMFYGYPLHHLVAAIEGVSHEKPVCPRCIVVGTHIDKMKESELKKRPRDIMQLVETKASDMRVPLTAIYRDMITLDTRNASQCKQVTNAIVDIVSSNKDIYEIDIPLKFIFLRWYLHKIKQKFMTRAELISHGKKCGVDDREIDKFLKLFRDCGSIISSEDEQHFLHDNFIMYPVEFFKELFRLYTMKEDGTIPHEYLASSVNGVVSVRTLKSLWQGQAGEISVSDFFIKALDNFGMLAEIGNDEFYIASLKSGYDASDIHPDSLIITADMPYIPLRRQVEFVKYFKNNQTVGETVDFLASAGPGKNFCNVTYFKFGPEEVKIKVRVSFPHIEVSFLEINYKKPEAYSLLKTALVDIMKNICNGTFRFNFNILCPNKKDKEHLIPFEISDSTVDKCPKCQNKLNLKDKKLSIRVLWIQAAYQGSQQSLLHRKDILNPKNIQQICETLQKISVSTDNLIKISRQLAERCNAQQVQGTFSLDQFSSRHRSVQDILFHVIYTWKCSNVRSSTKTLAQEIMDMGYYKEAYAIDPTLYNKPDNSETSVLLTDTQILVISDWWPVEPSHLAKILKVKLSPDDSMTEAQQCRALLERWMKDNPTGNQFKKVISLLEHNEYYIPTEYFMI